MLYDNQLKQLEYALDQQVAAIEDSYGKRQDLDNEHYNEYQTELYDEQLAILEEQRLNGLVSEDEYYSQLLDLQNNYNQSTIDSETELNEILANDSLSASTKQAYLDKYYANLSAKTEKEKNEAVLSAKDEAAKRAE